MFVLKALAVGFGIVLSLIIVTFVYVYLQAAPNEKATGIIVVLASPYYWIMVILVVALEAWFLMRHRPVNEELLFVRRCESTAFLLPREVEAQWGLVPQNFLRELDGSVSDPQRQAGR